MNIENLTNVEIIYNTNLKNKLLIQIPHTQFHILCTYKKKSAAWDVYVLELTSTKRKKIGSNISKESVAMVVEQTIKDGKNKAFKNKNNIGKLSEEIKYKIEQNNKQNKTYEKLQRNRIGTPRNRTR
jgi:superfamily I DNA and/or RNA helicase